MKQKRYLPHHFGQIDTMYPIRRRRADYEDTFEVRSFKRTRVESTFLPLRGLVRRDTSHPIAYRYATEWTGRPIDNQMSPKGLENIGNDCYRNTSWQSLLAVPAFCNWLQQYHSPLPSGRGRKCLIEHCPGCQLHRVFDVVYPEDPNSDLDEDGHRPILREVDNFFARRDLVLAGDIHDPSLDKTWTDGGREGTIVGRRCGSEDAGEYL